MRTAAHVRADGSAKAADGRWCTDDLVRFGATLRFRYLSNSVSFPTTVKLHLDRSRPGLAVRFGPARLSAETGVPARTISRILLRHRIPPLAWLDPVPGTPIRATRATAKRDEHEHPGDLVHVDVKKLGRIPDGDGWRAKGWTRANHQARVDKKPIGFDYVHAAVDDHTRRLRRDTPR